MDLSKILSLELSLKNMTVYKYQKGDVTHTDSTYFSFQTGSIVHSELDRHHKISARA